MKRTSIVISLAILVLSLFVGAVSAQDETGQPDDRPRRERVFLGDIMEIVTEATGLTNSEILQQMQDGATLAEVITNAGADLTLVREQVDATVLEQVDVLFNTQFEFDRFGMGLRDRARMNIIGELASAVTDATGLTLREIAEQVRDGATLADVIAENDGDVDEIVSAVVAAVTENVNERVDNGQITQEQGDTILETLETRMNEILSGEVPFPMNPARARGRNN